MIKKAIILAAGFGKRMRPVTELIPKALLPIAGTPTIRHIISRLSSYGIRDIVITLHHKSYLIKNEFKKKPPRKVKIFFSEESTILGTAGGIRAAASMVGMDSFIVINSDVLAEIDFEDTVRFHQEKEAVCTMVLRRDKDADSHGAVEIDHEGRVRRFLGAPEGYKEKLSKYMFTGIQIVSPSFISRIPLNKYCDVSKEIYPLFVEKGAGIYGYVMNNNWIDIGKPDQYLTANFQQLGKDGLFVHEIGDEVKILHPVYIGMGLVAKKGVIVGPNCSIGDGCIMYEQSKISESIIMDRVSIGKGAVISRSILSPNVSIPAGKHIENKIVVRLHGKNSYVSAL